MGSHMIKVGSRVRPTYDPMSTKAGLTYGYVREINGEEARVYWPKIKSEGRWPLYLLEIKAPRKRIRA